MRMTMEQYEAKIKKWANKAPESLRLALEKAAGEIIVYAQGRKLRGPKMPRGVPGGFDGSTLAAPTGRLRGSLTKRVTVSGGRVVAQVGTNVKYAAIHEYGGTIEAKGGGRLHFVIGGVHYSPKSVKIPERPFLRPSVAAQKSRTLEIIGDAYIDAYRRA